MPAFEKEVRQFIVDNFLFGENDERLGAEDSLLGKGLIDSTGILELVGFVQKTFEVKIEDEEIIPDNFDSIRKIAEFVRCKTGDAGGRSGENKSSRNPDDREMA